MKKLLTLLCTFVLMIGISVQAQNKSLRQLANAQNVSPKTQIEQKSIDINTLKERIALNQTKYQGNKVWKEHSLLHQVKSAELRTRAMVAMAAQKETIDVDMGHCQMEKLASYNVWNFLIQKDNRQFLAYAQPRFCGVGCQYQSDFTNDAWYDSNVQWGLISYETGSDISSSVTTHVTLLNGEDEIRFDLYYDCSDAIYHIIMVYDSKFQYDANADDSDDFEENYSYLSDDIGYKEPDNGKIEILADKTVSGTTKETDLIFYTSNTSGTNVIPTGHYPINNTGNVGTVQSGLGYDNGVLGSYAINISNNSITPPLYHIDQGDVYVVNLNNSDEPYIYLWAVTGYGAVVNVTIGTEPANYTVTVGAWEDANGNGFGIDFNTELLNADLENRIFTFWQGTTLTLKPYHVEGYHFKNWTGTYANEITPNGDGTYSLTIGAKNYTISAVFEADGVVYADGTISAVASPSAGGHVDVSPSAPHTGGTEVCLTPVNNSGYIFTGWLDGGNANPRFVTVDGTREYTAIFTPTHTITGTASPSAYGSVSGGGVYPEGANVTLTAIANSGYRFVNWSDGPTTISRNITVGNADAGYIANFEEIPTINLSYTGTLEKKSGFFRIIPSSSVVVNGQTYSFRFETNASWRTGNVTSIIDFSGPYTYTYLKKNGSTLTLNNSACTATITQIYGASYQLTATFIGEDETIYNITMSFKAPLSNDCGENYSINYAINEIEEITKEGNNTYYIRTGQRPYNTVLRAGYLRIVIPSNAYNNSYIPSGIYNVQTEGESRAIPSNGTYNNTNVITIGCGYKFVNSSNNTIKRWFLTDGTIKVINPNKNGTPMYIYTDGKNSSGYTIQSSIGTAPVLRLITFTTDGGNGNTASFTCAEGHGYTSSGIDSEETGNYYYNGTKLYLSATVADPANYRFKGWQIGSQLYTDVAQTNYEYTVSGAVSISAVFERIYAITITTPSHGTLTVMDGSTTINNGDKVAEGRTLTVTYSGNGYDADISPALDANKQFTVSTTTTVSAVVTAHTYNITYNGLEGADNSGNTRTTYTIEDEDINLADPGTRTHYTFKEWQEGGVAVTKIAHGSYGNKTLTAVWTANKYTVTFYDEDGTSVLQSSDVEYNTKPACDEPAKTATAQYTYAFAGWTDGTNTYSTADLPLVSGEATYTATYSSTVNKYTVTWQNYDNNALETDEDVEYGAIPSYNGSTPTKAEDENFSYTFAGWDGDITAPVKGDITFTATYTSLAKAFMLYDDKNSGDSYYTTLAGLEGQEISSVTYDRNFAAKTWNVFSLPFNYSLIGINRTFAGDVYELTGINYDYQENYLTLFFTPQTIGIVANRPYLYYSETGIDMPVFTDVTISSLANKYYSVNNSGAGGSIEFRNTTCRQQLTRNDHNVIFITNNKLYYMSDNDVYMRAFRGYFYVNGFDLNVGVAPRVRISLDGQTATELEVVSDMPNPADGQVKKYIENGVMVIEREGVKYNATGAKIN